MPAFRPRRPLCQPRLPRVPGMGRRVFARLAAMRRGSKRVLMAATDSIALPLCLAIALHVDGSVDQPVTTTVLLLTALCIAALSMSSFYAATVRRLEERTVVGAGVALALAVVALHLLTAGGAPRLGGAALAVYWLVAMLYLIASRTAVRVLLRSCGHTLTAAAEARSSAADFPLEHLLGRAPVQPDGALFARCVRDKGVLVTGAGGSIGSELCRQVAGLGPRSLHLIDHSEYALYCLAQELRTRWPQLALHAHLGSVCSEDLLERVLHADRIDTIYHAAAYKHVSIVEANVVEGLRNNVVGARAVAAAAARHGVATCVLVSSDKAVRPSTIMGASKRISELVFQAAAALQAEGDSSAANKDADEASNEAPNHASDPAAHMAPGAQAQRPRTVFSMVRFGNVLGSSGSVVPLFRRQLQQGGPLTVTDAAMERYFMLIPEAAQLVIQAGAMADGGEVFVLDMGQPLRIVDLARRMIALAGLTERTPAQPQGDIEIRYVGLCPGEKLQEELLVADGATASRHPRILHMKEQALAPALLDQYVAQLLAACDSHDRRYIDAMLRTIVTDFGRASASTSPSSAPVLAAVPVAPHAAASVAASAAVSAATSASTAAARFTSPVQSSCSVPRQEYSHAPVSSRHH